MAFHLLLFVNFLLHSQVSVEDGSGIDDDDNDAEGDEEDGSHDDDEKEEEDDE